MLVYGDHQFSADLHSLCAGLRTLAQRCRQRPHDLDLLRALLIACGQVEQGAHDALDAALPAEEAAPIIAAFHASTAHAADAFYALAWQQPAPLPPPRTTAPDALARLWGSLDTLLGAPNLTAAVKVPEGFNLHALYPEQYALAAGHWLADHADQLPAASPPAALPPVVVVGIRSIGTTLAAVVAAVLSAANVPVESFTVRPRGHPYARSVDLGARQVGGSTFALVVDEGPGISGSSMAATAAALVKAGIAPPRIAFLPGHANAPGGAGDEEVQRWWRTAPRYAVASDAVTFGGRPLREALAASLPEPLTQVEDFSGGTWRQHLYADQSAWPPICNFFERVKYRFTLRSGRQVLYKYLGLASRTPDFLTTGEAFAAQIEARAACGLAAPLVVQTLGFVATEWLEGAPLAGAVARPEMPEVLGSYIARTAGPLLTPQEYDAATARLVEMVAVNTREALGPEAAAVACHFRPAADCPRHAYGDGHLQPYEWLVRGMEPPRKVDGVGHDCDHTLVGRQPLTWDVAGAIVEWQLDTAAVVRLLDAYAAAGGPPMDTASLQFYRLAYVALRAGQCALAAEFHDPYEQARLWAAYAGYRQQLAELLKTRP